MTDESKDLSARVAALEQMMARAPAAQMDVEITPEELKAFRKVRDIIAFDPDNVCGINECFKCVAVCRTCRVCQICSICRVCRVCDFECVCGPCSLGSGGGGRFGGLGD